MSKQSEVRDFYAPAPLSVLPRTDGGFGIFAPNPNIHKPPCTLGVGNTREAAWDHAWQRIQGIQGEPE